MQISHASRSSRSAEVLAGSAIGSPTPAPYLSKAVATRSLMAAGRFLAQGITGKLETWWRGGAFPAMILDIEGAAKLTASESDTEGLRIVRWRPFGTALHAQDAVPSRADSSRIAAEASAARP